MQPIQLVEGKQEDGILKLSIYIVTLALVLSIGELEKIFIKSYITIAKDILPVEIDPPHNVAGMT